MGIYLDEETPQTIAVCDRCDVAEATNVADGKIPDDWMSGMLWLDLSLGEQRQTPLCFCPGCKEKIADAELIQISAR